jgi:hypothetical protein
MKAAIEKVTACLLVASLAVACNSRGDERQLYPTLEAPQAAHARCEVACASSAECQAGEVCTTEDGVCNPPPPSCSPGDPCFTLCYGTCRPVGSEPPPPGPCRTDADCRTFSDTCTSCRCLALSLCQADPVCPGPGGQCLTDPCDGVEAFCSSGTCALRRATELCPTEACGPPLGLPSYLCPDGKTVAGPTDRCLLKPDGSCGWEIAPCPDPAICGGGRVCSEGLAWCTLNGQCTDPACLSCCQFGRVCKTAEDCGGPICVTCPSGARACSDPACGTAVPGQCHFPEPVCP